jgi:hypothetical protein
VTTLAEKERFAEKYLTAPDGEPFSFSGRDWLRNEIWRPLDGWKLWPVDAARLCVECSARANTIVDDYSAADKTRTAKHLAAGCAGLVSEPILVVAAHVKRQSGKTMGVAGYAMARAFLDDRESIGLLAGSEGQAARLYAANYARPVEASEELAERARCLGTKIVVSHGSDKRSEIEILPTAMSSIGDTRTLTIIDECRIVPPNIAVALQGTLFARGGWECPAGHFRSHAGVEDSAAPRKCSVCHAKAKPWYGKSLLLSSAGEIEDTDADWFFELKDFYGANPHKNVHVFDTTETLNPKVSQKVMSATAEIFGNLDSTRTFADTEAGNVPRRRGEEFVGKSEINACMHASLDNLAECDRACVAFLDMARRKDKITLTIVGDSGTGGGLWDSVDLLHVSLWDPRAFPAKEMDEAAYAEVKAAIKAVVPMFPGIVGGLRVDVRGDLWAQRLAKELPKAGVSAEAWTKNTDMESDAGWKLFEQRVKSQTIRMIDGAIPPGRQRNPPRTVGEIIRAELRGVEVKDLRDGPRVVDKNRRKSHKDLTEGIALCCYLVAKIKIGAGKSSPATRLATRLGRVAVAAKRDDDEDRENKHRGGSIIGGKSWQQDGY